MNRSLRNQFQKELRSRWKSSWPGQGAFGRLRATFDRNFNAMNELALEAEKLVNRGMLSSKGLQEQVREFAQAKAVPVYWSGSKALEAARTELADQRKSLAVPEINRGEVAGAILRGEMRSYLRSLGSAKAMATLMADDVDDQMIYAAFEAPAQMAGLTDQMRENLSMHLIDTRHPTEKASLDQLAEAIELTGSNLEFAINQMREDIGFSDNQLSQFDGWMRSATKHCEQMASNPESLERMFARVDAETEAEIDAIIAKALAS